MPSTKIKNGFMQKTITTSGHVAGHFCKNTSFHGLKFIVEPRSHWIERIIWAFIFLLGVGFSFYFCWQVWVKYETAPLLMSLETTRYSLSSIPFPAVTICNVNKVRKSLLNSALSKDPRFDQIPYEKIQQALRFMTKWDRAIDNESDLRYLSDLFNTTDISKMDLFNLLKTTAPTCRDMVLDCTWKGFTKDCYDYLSFLPTDDGLCCVFNGAPYIDSDLGIESRLHPLLYASGNGYKMGLSLVLNVALDEYSVTNGKSDGFKVLVHATQKFPDVADRGFVVGPGSETFVGVKATSAYTADEVATLSKEKRRCRTDEDEGGLNYFPRYSQSGCITECATKKMKENCSCRPFFVRSEMTELCDIKSYDCIGRTYENVRGNADEYCVCPPPCADEWFEPEVSTTNFPGHGFNLSRTYKRLVNNTIFQTAISNNKDYLMTNVALLHVYYKDRTGIRYKTDIRFGIEDFISAMGGLLSLGLGMSFISIAELIYFMFLRGFCYTRFAPTSRGNVNIEKKIADATPLSYKSGESNA